MLHCLSVISSQIKCGSPEVAISHGVWLGIAYERFRVRASEHKAWTGGQNLQASSKGGRTTGVDVHYPSTRQVDPAALLRLKQVLALVPVSASTWWSGVRSGRFPRPVKLGPRTTTWRARDVLALIDSLSGDENGRPAGDER